MKELQIRAYFSIDKVRSELYTYHLYNGESEVGPDSRHVPLSYFILFQNTLEGARASTGLTLCVDLSSGESYK